MNIKKLTRVRLESPGCKYKETLLLQTKLIKTTTDDDGQTINKARKKGGLDKEHVNRLESTLAKGIDYSKNPPIVVRKNTLGKNGEKFEYVLITGHHRMEAFKNQGITEWLFDVYEVGTKTIPFDLAKSSLQIRENDHTPELANTADDLVNIISYLISKNHLTNSEKEIKQYLQENVKNLHWATEAKVVRKAVRKNGAYQDIRTYTFNEVKTILENDNNNYVHSNELDSKREKYGATVLEGYEYEFLSTAIKSFGQTNVPSYFLCHTNAPTEKRSLKDRRKGMKKNLELMQLGILKAVDYFKENNKWPWEIEAFFGQNVKDKEQTFIKPEDIN